MTLQNKNLSEIKTIRNYDPSECRPAPGLTNCPLIADFRKWVGVKRDFGGKNVKGKRCTYDTTLTSLSALVLIQSALLNNVNMTSYVQGLRSAFLSPKVPNI